MKTLQLVFLLFIASNALAETNNTDKQPKQYDVEIIIFEDAHARYIDSESWNINTSQLDAATADNAKTSNIAEWPNITEANQETKAFEAIKPAILSKEYRRINHSSEFNVLLYTAWRQTGLSEANAFEININELENAHKRKSKNTISGSVKIVLARYLHFYSQLKYQRKNNSATNQRIPDGSAIDSTTSGTPITDGVHRSRLIAANIYPIQSHRRMRSKELHYIDHPLVGILVQINPVEEKSAAEQIPARQESTELSNPNR